MDDTCHPCEEPIVDRTPACPLHCGVPTCKAYAKKPPLDLSGRPIVWVIGGPGSGSKILAKKVANKYGFTIFLVGDLIREEIQAGGKRAYCFASVTQRFELAPNDAIVDLLKTAIEKNAKTAKGFVIEGFPRHDGQGVRFERTIAPVNVILYCEVPAETLANRLASGTFTSGRCKTDEDTINARLKQFFENNVKIIEQYPHKLIRLDGERSADEILQGVEKELDKLDWERLADEILQGAEKELIRQDS